MKHLISILFILLSVAAKGQEKIFTGKFDNKFHIRLSLTFDNKKVSGTALHQKSQKKYAVSGRINRKDQLSLTETDAFGNQAGKYELELFADFLLKGSYKFDKNETDLILKKDDTGEVSSEEEFLDQQLLIMAKQKANESRHIKEILSDFLACTSAQKPKNYCDRYLSMAYFNLHGFDDFGFGREASEFIPETEIPAELDKSPMWNKRGVASDGELVQKTIQWINEGIPVVAVKHLKGEKAQVALIVKGDGEVTGKWGEMKVPFAAAFLPEKPGLSSTNKPLSEAWSSPKEVEIWVRDGEIRN